MRRLRGGHYRAELPDAARWKERMPDGSMRINRREWLEVRHRHGGSDGWHVELWQEKGVTGALVGRCPTLTEARKVVERFQASRGHG